MIIPSLLKESKLWTDHKNFNNISRYNPIFLSYIIQYFFFYFQLDKCTVKEEEEDIDDLKKKLNVMRKSMVRFCFIVCSCIYIFLYICTVYVFVGKKARLPDGNARN